MKGYRVCYRCHHKTKVHRGARLSRKSITTCPKCHDKTFMLHTMK